MRDREATMEPLKTFSFLDNSVRSVPFDGPLHQIRPVVKWVAIVYLLVMIVLSTLVLHEQKLSSALFQAAPILVCIWWLWKTRARQETIQVPVTISFYQNTFTLDRADTLCASLRGDVRLREFYRLEYDKVTKISYDLAYRRVMIYGHTESAFYHWNGNEIEDRPYRTKDANDGAVSYWTDGLSPEENERLLETLTKYTGIAVERYGSARE